MAGDDQTDGKDQLREFMAAAEAMNEGMSEVMASALRLQMLMLEDTQNMMAEIATICDAKVEGGETRNDGDDESRVKL
ncbi:MAG: hypothetical protein OEN23_18075 [Paracoccaceae bacterium]|nr:hypothetical protein [Paracoccaceae bacterium]